MKIYLDIDGTLIHEEATDNYGKPALGQADFIIALRPYDTYWLTTHCRDGNPERAREILKQHLPPELHADIDRIKGTVWDTMKTQGIDWSSDFIWFDDIVFSAENEMLKMCTDKQSVVEVNLRNNPQQLIEITRDLL